MIYNAYMLSKLEKGLESRRAPVGGQLIERARRRAGLTQRQLADRLNTSQSLITRWENGKVEPSFDAVVRAIRACGLELSVGLAEYDHDHDRLIDENLSLTPTGRLAKMLSGLSNIKKLKRSARIVDA